MADKLRMCIAGNRRALFHGVFQVAQPVEPSIMVGGAPGGQLAYPAALVELPDGRLTTVGVSSIRFIDAEGEAAQDGKPTTAWIPMSDRHPPADGSYIIHTAKGAVCTAHYWGREKRFSGRGIQATHWMPLPKPPTEDSD